MKTLLPLVFITACESFIITAVPMRYPPVYSTAVAPSSIVGPRNEPCGHLLLTSIIRLGLIFRMLLSYGKLDGQPRAVNIQKMRWDDYLAKRAQFNTHKCSYGYEKMNDERFYAVGSNIHLEVVEGVSPNLEADWDSAIEVWFMQHKNYTYPNTATDEDCNTHYTQIVWAQTNHIGCGYTMFKKIAKTKTHYKYYYCYYGPAGNYYGHPPYETGVGGGENLL